MVKKGTGYSVPSSKFLTSLPAREWTELPVPFF